MDTLMAKVTVIQKKDKKEQEEKIDSAEHTENKTDKESDEKHECVSNEVNKTNVEMDFNESKEENRNKTVLNKDIGVSNEKTVTEESISDKSDTSESESEMCEGGWCYVKLFHEAVMKN